MNRYIAVLKKYNEFNLYGKIVSNLNLNIKDK
jgi:hypothetical protein